MSDKDYAKILDETLRTQYHEQDGNTILSYYQDVEPHLEMCAADRREDAENRGAFGARPEFHKKMSVPFNVIMGVAQKLGIPFARIFDTDCQRRIVGELKGPDYKHFRTTIDKAI